MNLKISEYSNETESFMSQFSKEKRYQLGQFFTPFSLVKLCLDKVLQYLPPKDDLLALEPSAGTGQFIDKFIQHYKNILTYEIDIEAFKKLEQKKIKCVNEDFLLADFKQKFDLIIGNPPYFELSEADKQKYKSESITGRYNIYALFVERCVDLLNENGILCFVIPNSLNSAPTFSKLRAKIGSCCELLEFGTIGNFSFEVFQDVQIFILRRTNKPAPKFYYDGNFMREQIAARTRIKDIAYVSTGNIVWNQHKADLLKESAPDAGILIYSDMIGGGRVDGTPPHEQFIRTNKPSLTFPCLLVTRTKSPRTVIIGACSSKLYAENHVNVVVAKDGKQETLLKIAVALSSDKIQEYVKSLSTTANFSKSQLEEVPID